MERVYQRRYRGPVKMVIFDWAGTTVDYGCYAPAVVFIEVFKRRNVQITMQQARAPMGLKKIDHIRATLTYVCTSRKFVSGALPINQGRGTYRS